MIILNKYHIIIIIKTKLPEESIGVNVGGERSTVVFKINSY